MASTGLGSSLSKAVPRGSRNQQSAPLVKRSSSLGNLQATHNRLRDILLNKEVQDTTAGGRRAPTQGVDPGLAPVGEDLTSNGTVPSPTAVVNAEVGTVDGGSGNIGVGRSSAACSSGAAQPQESPKSPKPKVSYVDTTPQPFSSNLEKEAFMAQICSDSTRLDVRDWVGRIYEILKKAPPKTEEDVQAKSTRRHRKAWSNSGASETSTYTSTTCLTTLMAAGGSIAAKTTATSRHAPSLISAESMVVHPGKRIELLSTEERIRAYLSREIPELTSHVNAHVAKRAEEVRREIDEELVESHLLQMRRQQVFNQEANMLRWQNSRRIALQKRLDNETPNWISEAVQSWDQKAATKAREEEVSETDLIFDYLTKRAAHINSNKLATEIPLFKTLHASYSLPRMWRDKYLDMH